MKKFALIWCSENPLLDYQAHMLEEFRSGTEHWDVLSPADDNFLELAKNYDGYVISGSEKSVVDDRNQPFLIRLFALLRHVREASQAPIVGICFGAQAIAVAFGGKVGRNQDGQFRLGVEPLQWLPHNEPGKWPEITTEISLVESHGESVLQMPANSVLLATSPTAPHEVFLLEDRFLAIQGHPEVDGSWLRSTFMPFHKHSFDDTGWSAVERESLLPVKREGILAITQRLLRDGSLQAGQSSRRLHEHLA